MPKDGPSAGVAMFMALASLLTGTPVRSDVAMTGEISLRGLVLPIGGVKEKVLAALRAGITTVMLPARNQRDLEDIPADARAQLEFVWMEQVDDAIKAALTPTPVEPARADAIALRNAAIEGQGQPALCRLVVGALALKIPGLRRLREGDARESDGGAHLARRMAAQVQGALPDLRRTAVRRRLVMPAVRIMSPPELKAFRESMTFPDHDPDPELYESKGGEWGYLKAVPLSSTTRCACTWIPMRSPSSTRAC